MLLTGKRERERRECQKGRVLRAEIVMGGLLFARIEHPPCIEFVQPSFLARIEHPSYVYLFFTAYWRGFSTHRMSTSMSLILSRIEHPPCIYLNVTDFLARIERERESSGYPTNITSFMYRRMLPLPSHNEVAACASMGKKLIEKKVGWLVI